MKMKGKKIDLPACDADNEGSGKCYTVSDSLFGVFPFGQQISGTLFYNFLADSTGCKSIDPTFGFKDNDANPTTKILLVDRGSCSFVRKVRMGQVCVSFIINLAQMNYSSFRLIDP